MIGGIYISPAKQNKRLRGDAMRYAQIREMDISNGRGIGVSLFVQGCHFHCRGCFNPETWDFRGGKEWNEEIQNEFIQLADRPYVKRVSILGGEPLADKNVLTVYMIIQEIRGRLVDKEIWLYTGYTWEEIMKPHSLICESALDTIRRNVAESADYIIDGKFDIAKQDLFNKEIVWAGSSNQRVIDVKRTLETDKMITI